MAYLIYCSLLNSSSFTYKVNTFSPARISSFYFLIFSSHVRYSFYFLTSNNTVQTMKTALTWIAMEMLQKCVLARRRCTLSSGPAMRLSL